MNQNIIEIITTELAPDYTCTASCCGSGGKTNSETDGGAGCEGSESSGCGCSGGSETLTIDELKERFLEKYQSLVDTINVYQFTSENKEETIKRLNHILAHSGERLVIDEQNVDFIISKIVPVIAFNGKLLSIKNYPTEEQLFQAIITGERIPMKPSCY